MEDDQKRKGEWPEEGVRNAEMGDTYPMPPPPQQAPQVTADGRDEARRHPMPKSAAKRVDQGNEVIPDKAENITPQSQQAATGLKWIPPHRNGVQHQAQPKT